MGGIGTGWLKRVVIATAILAAIGLYADTGRAMAAESGGDAGSATHAVVLFLFAWLISSIRVRRKAGRLRFGFEPSPVPRVRAASTVRSVNARKAAGNSGEAGV
ncbi:hypothetical protein [Mesorhizobium sp. IMUNJ 23232]|uniref:hypothetical protein n=1 Tax=Mesorhizobium sp. IMUNJ 23232 TaxID=3376064 RepID=UPI0037B6F3CE